jgi:hypothetical protein
MQQLQVLIPSFSANKGVKSVDARILVDALIVKYLYEKVIMEPWKLFGNIFLKEPILRN